MRMWNVPPYLMCNKHILGEHVEMHMFIGSLKKNHSIQGYIDKGLVNPYDIVIRHDALVEEMEHRGMNHQSPLNYDCSSLPIHFVDEAESRRELAERCSYCRRLLGMYIIANRLKDES